MLGSQLLAGTVDARGTSRTNRVVEVVLGVDFGTSSTKIVARLPYEAGSPAFAIPVPTFAQAESHPYLWASRLWLAPDGVFSLSPLPHAAVSCAIKANLMAQSNRDRPVLSAMAAEATAEETASAFLALQLRHARGWLALEKGAVLSRGRVQWSFNFGFPAASLDDAELRDRYERCVAAALMLAGEQVDITLCSVRAALAAVAADTTSRLEHAQAALFPEIAAAVSGFANSTRLEDGLYALVDVGGGTVDCCTFNLFKAEHGGARCPIFNARVEMLGVEPWRLCKGDPASAEDFRYLLDTQQRMVIWDAKRKRYPNSGRWRTGLPIFFVGGGVASKPHRDSTAGLDAWLQHHAGLESGVRIEALPAPESLEHPLCANEEVHRLAVAIGLSMQAIDIPEVNLPGDIDDAPQARRFGTESNYVDKDQV